MSIGFILIAGFTLYLNLWYINGDICKLEKTCTETCFRSSRYYEKCGVFGWARCSKYRRVSYICAKSCEEEVCCTGYTGDDCNTPICFNSTTCANWGTCVSPDNCTCIQGYSEPACDDIDECGSDQHMCKHICVNTIGTFKCACNAGYMLQPDLLSCSDVDECMIDNGRCNQGCVNTEGSYICVCNEGYHLSADGLTCTDENECVNSTHDCEHGCTNTPGSFKCYCHTGYDLDTDGKSCIDLDECVLRTAECNQQCVNTEGSYMCGCDTGYILQPDRITCNDVDECLVNNGGCDTNCTNQPGGYYCSCGDGYGLINEHECGDIDECKSAIVCDQTCTNTVGSFFCTCQDGYILGTDGKSCENVDDCVGVSCQNNATCIDKVLSFTCACSRGYTGVFCEQDVNECSMLNGGCSDICENTFASFICSCKENRTLGTDKRTCEGDVPNIDVFERLRIPRKLLPVGCFSFNVYNTQRLISTLPWFCHNKDPSICYTSGIVHIEIKTRLHPVSIQGVKITNKNLKSISVNGYKKSQGSVIEQEGECKEIVLSPIDIQQFIKEGSFIRNFFTLLRGSFPSWLSLSPVQPHTLSIPDMKSEVKTGGQISNIEWCSKAPVMHDRMYLIFRFTTAFKLEIYNKSVFLPEATKGERFCVVADISQYSNGTVFILIPKRVSETVGPLTEYLKTSKNVRGLGVSLDAAINVDYSSLAFWNGYDKFTPSLPSPRLWVGSHTVLPLFIIEFEGNGNYFKSTSNLETVFGSFDPYSSLSTLHVTVAPTFQIRVLGKSYNETLAETISLDLDLYKNMEGVSHCDENDVPDGIYTALKLTINPFKNVPIIRHWSPYQDPLAGAYLLVGCQLTEPFPVDFSQDIQALNKTLSNLFAYEKVLTEINNMSSRLFDKLKSFQSLIQRYNNNSLDEKAQRNFPQNAWISFTEVQNQATQLGDLLEFSVSITTDNFLSFLDDQIIKIKMILDKMVFLTKSAPRCNSLGFKFEAEVSFEVTKKKLDIGFFNVEIIYSEEPLKCSRFDAVSKLLADQPSIRVIGQATTSLAIGVFLDINIGGGIGMVMSRDINKAVLQVNVILKILGVHYTVDIFFTFEKIYAYYEVNIWNLFFAHIDVEIHYETYGLVFDVNGRFVAKGRKKRQTQTRVDFTASYSDGLKKIINKIASEANTRITLLQMSVTDAQKELMKTQDYFKKQKAIFSNKEAVMNEAKSIVAKTLTVVDKARANYERAVDKLKTLKIIIDNLCKIRKCSSLCIPGIRCKICSKKAWFVRIYYPCCFWSRCMFRIKDPICILKNIACKVIQSLAFAALEAAKIVEKAMLIPYVAAEVALDAAEIIADKTQWAFEIAAHVFDLATLALEAANQLLELSKKALYAVKLILSAAVKVFNMMIEYGLKNIVDVRDCRFQVQISVRDLPIFDVLCDINLFKLGWKTYMFPINFLHPHLSIYNAARAVIHNGLQMLQLFGRKKREVFQVSSVIYSHLRKSRDIYDAIINLNETIGFESNPNTDYAYRKTVYAEKCTEIQNIEKFMQTYFSLLYTLTNDSNNIYNVKQEFEDDISSMEENNINNIMEDLSFENLDVSRDHARADYNLTDEEINLAEEQSRNEILNSSVLSDFNAIVNISRNNTDAELNYIESFNFISYWLASMDNGTDKYFPPDICWGFKDCVLHCLSSLYNLFAEEQVPDLDMIQNIIMRLDDIATNLFLNQNITLKELVSVMDHFNSTMTDLMKLNPFCSTAPVFRHDVRNITAVNGSKVSFSCDAVGDPQPDVWWFKDGKIIAGEDKAYLEISNIGPEDEAAYHCVVGNVVANLSSNEAWLTVVGNIVSDSDKSNGTNNYLRNVLIGLAVMVFIGFGIAVLYIIQRKNRHNCITPVDTKDNDNMAAKSSEYPDIFELQNRPKLMIKKSSA